jgi:hypothetical protein
MGAPAVSLEIVAPEQGLFTYSADQWSALRTLAKAVVEERLAADGDVLLLESQRLGVLPEAQLVADLISDDDYLSVTAHRARRL